MMRSMRLVCESQSPGDCRHLETCAPNYSSRAEATTQSHVQTLPSSQFRNPMAIRQVLAGPIGSFVRRALAESGFLNLLFSPYHLPPALCRISRSVSLGGSPYEPTVGWSCGTAFKRSRARGRGRREVRQRGRWPAYIHPSPGFSPRSSKIAGPFQGTDTGALKQLQEERGEGVRRR